MFPVRLRVPLTSLIQTRKKSVRQDSKIYCFHIAFEKRKNRFNGFLTGSAFDPFSGFCTGHEGQVSLVCFTENVRFAFLLFLCKCQKMLACPLFLSLNVFEWTNPFPKNVCHTLTLKFDPVLFRLLHFTCVQIRFLSLLIFQLFFFNLKRNYVFREK